MVPVLYLKVALRMVSGRARRSSRAAERPYKYRASAPEGSSSADSPFCVAFFRVYDFENEFQFQLQGYSRGAKPVNPPPYNRV